MDDLQPGDLGIYRDWLASVAGRRDQTRDAVRRMILRLNLDVHWGEARKEPPHKHEMRKQELKRMEAVLRVMDAMEADHG